MTQTRPVQNTFSSGENDPLLFSRNDFQRVQTGLARAKGFLPMRQGAFTRAPGTIFRGTTKFSAPAIRIPFQFAVNDALALEFTDRRMRVWRYGELVTKNGQIYELDTPYRESDLANLHYVQDSDAVYIVDGRQPMQKLSRFALNNWTIEPAELTNGPFRVRNLDESRRLRCDGATGTITVRAQGDIFKPEHVGALFRIEPESFNNVPLWVGNQQAILGMRVRFDGRIYSLTFGDTTGVSPPTHESGTALSFPATKWKFVSDLVGIVRIDKVNSPYNADARVIKRIPEPAVDDWTYRWAESAWSDVQGYPACIASYRRRMYAANSGSDPRMVWASTIGLYTDFEFSEDADAAFAYEIDGEGTRNEIQWLKRGQRGIYIGALGETYRGFSAAAGEAIGPLTFDIDLVDSDGVSPAKPILPYGFPLYIARDRTRVQETRYSFETDQSKPLELSLPAQHLGVGQYEQIVWQSSPHRRAWLRTASGQLICFAYDPDQDVLGWAEVPLAGGFVEHLDVTVGEDGAFDVLTLIVRREFNGEPVRCVEELATNRLAMLGAVPPSHFNHAYSSSVFTADPASSTFSVPHLAGQTVWAWTDQGQFGPLEVAGNGEVDLGAPVSRATIGLIDETHYADTHDIQAAGRNGDTRGRKRKLDSATGIDLFKTAAGQVSVVERHFDDGDRVLDPVDLTRFPAAEILTQLRSGTRRIDTPSGNADAVRLRFKPIGLAPMTVSAVIPNIDEAGA